jgi:beta-lactamase superfamily II metal-dependent hydrolase
MFVGLIAFAALCIAQPRTLDIYWVDVEGGAATLIVAPTGESLLVDTGFPGQGDRDAKRIVEAAKAAGLDHIDHLLITHYHIDHVGGVPGLAKLIDIRHFYDHGDNTEPMGAASYNSYLALTEGKRTILKPGDKFTLGAATFDVVSAAGDVIAKPLERGKSVNHCEGVENKATDMTENSKSTGFVMQYGKFSFFDVGDLTWDREMQLACPANKIGEVTLLQATHHGFSNGQSGNPALVWSLRPQVVVVNNGGRKGFSNGGYDVIAKIPNLEGIWQGHRGEGNDAAHNTVEEMIANPVTAGDEGHWIKASVAADGKFTVTNRRNGFAKSYTAR